MEVTVIRSARKTLSIQVNPDLTVIVRAPRRATNKEIERLLFEKQDWIEKHLEKFRKQKELVDACPVEPLSNADIKKLADEALNFIPQRVAYYARLVGVSYGRITIRNQKTRWGSCSSQGNLNFNCLLMLTTPEVIDYVVVHELCHRKQMNHSKVFWSEVEKVLPDYKKQVAWLKKEGGAIMRRME